MWKYLLVDINKYLYILSVSDKISKNDMLLWNSNAKHPIVKIKQRKKMKRERSVVETLV